ncbi:hypothetical protein L596_013520 [Steinernema carpocapsae]|nr:hypothetical protein L596_013520 [Steinernema carpocapsae]
MARNRRPTCSYRRPAAQLPRKPRAVRWEEASQPGSVVSLRVESKNKNQEGRCKKFILPYVASLPEMKYWEPTDENHRASDNHIFPTLRPHWIVALSDSVFRRSGDVRRPDARRARPNAVYQRPDFSCDN